MNQVEVLEERVDELERALRTIDDWARAYPLEVFPEIDREVWRAVDAYLTQGGFSLSRISASNMRHVIEGVRGITVPVLK